MTKIDMIQLLALCGCVCFGAGWAACDVGVSVLPSGRSASWEFGYIMGQGKPGVVYMPEACEPELMYSEARILVSEDELRVHFNPFAKKLHIQPRPYIMCAEEDVMIWMLTYQDYTSVVRGGFDCALNAAEDMALDLDVQGCEIAIDRIPETRETQTTPAVSMQDLVFAR